jgi:rhamnosyltransferase
MKADCQPGNSTPTFKSICAIVVTFHPDRELPLRIEKVTKQVDRIVILDNGSGENSSQQLRTLGGTLGIHLILNSRNEGVAHALNQGMRWAESQGCDWALTLDQDTLVADDFVQTLSNIYDSVPENKKPAIIGSNYIDPIKGNQFAAFDGNNDSAWKEVKTVITSGSLISLSAYRAIGPFREELFIDCVDFEYCLRARGKGFHVIMACRPLMQHGIGATTLHKLPWKRTGTSNHSAIRRYYMTRNQIVLAREYLGREPVWMLSALYRHLKDLILMCFFEKDVFHKLRFTILGLLDGITLNFGRNPH